jgi:hypothetical protein
MEGLAVPHSPEAVMVSQPLALFALSLSLLGCRGATDNSPNYSLTGNWRQSADMRDDASGDSHIHLGSYRLAETGQSFSGSGSQTGTCSSTAHGSYTGPLSDGAPFQVTNGLVNAMQVTFKTNICSYQGSFENGNPNRITGTGTCSYTLNNISYTFTGTWQADRQ